MQLTIESTTQVVGIDGTRTRVWEGRSASGVPVTAFIARVAVDEAAGAEVHAQFRRELEECAQPTIAWPLERELAHRAIRHVLDRAERDSELGRLLGPYTEAWERLVRAEAALDGRPYAPHRRKFPWTRERDGSRWAYDGRCLVREGTRLPDPIGNDFEDGGTFYWRELPAEGEGWLLTALAVPRGRHDPDPTRGYHATVHELIRSADGLDEVPHGGAGLPPGLPPALRLWVGGRVVALLIPLKEGHGNNRLDAIRGIAAPAPPPVPLPPAPPGLRAEQRFVPGDDEIVVDLLPDGDAPDDETIDAWWQSVNDAMSAAGWAYETSDGDSEGAEWTSYRRARAAT